MLQRAMDPWATAERKDTSGTGGNEKDKVGYLEKAAVTAG